MFHCECSTGVNICVKSWEKCFTGSGQVSLTLLPEDQRKNQIMIQDMSIWVSYPKGVNLFTGWLLSSKVTPRPVQSRLWMPLWGAAEGEQQCLLGLSALSQFALWAEARPTSKGYKLTTLFLERFYFPNTSTCFPSASPPALQRALRTKQVKVKGTNHNLDMQITQPAKFHFQNVGNWNGQSVGTFQSDKATSVASKEKYALYLTLSHLDTHHPIFPLQSMGRGSFSPGSHQSTSFTSWSSWKITSSHPYFLKLYLLKLLF